MVPISTTFPISSKKIKQPSRALVGNCYKAFEERREALNKARHLFKVQDLIDYKRKAYSGSGGY